MNSKLIFVGNPTLRKMSKPVDKITDEIRQIINDMKAVMKAESGIGLAAPQIGKNLRILIFTDPGSDQAKPVIHTCINPEIITESDEQIEMNEGCLSVQGSNGPVFANLTRSETVTATWTGLNGQKKQHLLAGMAARAFLHEMDHLNGILFIDYLSDLKREMVMGKVRKRKT